MQRLYQKIGVPIAGTQSGFETIAARTAGETVLSELSRHQRSAVGTAPLASGRGSPSHSILFPTVDAMRSAYDEVYAYTMGRPGFILQHVVDAQAAQTATGNGKPIGVVFALVGLYLHVEKNFSGHQVQKAHSALAQRKRAWPIVDLPSDRGAITVADVLAASPGLERDKAIDAWCGCVWKAFAASRQAIVNLLQEYQIG